MVMSSGKGGRRDNLFLGPGIEPVSDLEGSKFQFQKLDVIT
jgi:hypothetical protein